ncbi:hypothetical protein [Nocardia sp. NPDC051463]|uniref:hypothetical protein n=1 Tax=Nocardia sp. NPDC051463 TaxID=3154845 RepID=UPI00343FBFD4
MTPWLPLLSSLVVAGVALIGVVINNRTNRGAIAAADERNQVILAAAQRTVELTNSAAEQRGHETWRRETILTTVSSVLAVATEVRQQLSACHRWNVGGGEDIDRIGEDIEQTIWGRGGLINKLRVLSDREIPGRCEDLLRTLTAARNITLQRLKIEMDDEATGEEMQAVLTLWTKAIARTVEEERSVINATRAELGIDGLSDIPEFAPEPLPDLAQTQPV